MPTKSAVSAGARTINEAFWTKFSQHYWEKKPVTVKRISSPILQMDAAAIFRLLVAYSDLCRKERSAAGFKFFIDGESQYDDVVLRMLPRKNDRSLEGYHERMNAQFDDYCLVCDELMEVNAENWSLVASFLDGLYGQIGLPNRFSEIGLYLGNYRKTPFGVHIDGCGVLSLPVLGEKRFRIWDPTFVEKNPDLKQAHEYEKFKKNSTLLKARVGDLTYWPSTHWHIAESDGQFSATWSLGVWVDKLCSDVVFDGVKPFLKNHLGAIGKKTSLKHRSLQTPKSSASALATALPEDLERAVELLSELPKAQLRDALILNWLEHASRKAFKRPPRPRRSASLLASDRFIGKPEHPVLWATLSDQTLAIAAGGVVTTLPCEGALERLLSNLGAGKSVSPKGQPSSVKGLLKTLYRAHSLEKI